MKHARIHIFTILLIIGLSGADTSGTASSDAGDVRQEESKHDEFLRLIDVDDPKSNVEDESGDDLPVLPPIILLDFGNGTADENATFEEKSKRTVNNGIGYGIEKNTLQPRRYNYYFPGGKTGTTVSIEESISPFMPKTIIEKIQPDDRRNGANRPYGTYQNLFDTAASLGQSQTHLNFQYVNNPQSSSKTESVFGLRTKLQKTPAGFAFETYRNHLSTPKPSGFYGLQNSGYGGNGFSTTTPSSLSFGSTESVRYTTPSPLSYVTSQGNSFNYPTQSPFSHQPASPNVPTYSGQRQNLRTNANPPSYSYRYQNVESSTARPLDHSSQFSGSGSGLLPNTPRYTTENGVRYENKIFWKYPDGRVSDVPPATYVETYSEYPDNTPITEEAKSPSPLSIYETGGENGVYSQGPVKFPTAPESSGREPNPFVSSDSVSSSLPQQQVYRLSYQNLVTQKHNPNLAQPGNPNGDATSSYSSPSPSASGLTSTGSRSKSANQKIRYGTSYLPQRKPSKYMVNSPNPEYNDDRSTGTTAKSTPMDTSFFTPSAGGNSKKEDTSDQRASSYPNLRYSDLLNYNPSISQYVRDPSSILNVQPTFVQAGNSLIPVIILRVDGASPVQPKVTPNVNLKALLQQYLIQYAKGIQDMRRPSSYALGTESIVKPQNSDPNGSPLLDFLRFTQTDSREEPSYIANSYNGRSSYESSDLDETKSFVNGQYGERTTGRKKVKNVQILEDPRFASYKAKNWQA